MAAFRTVVRTLSALALAVRAQRGPGPGETREAALLLASLRRRGLTDGQHVALFRTLTRPWLAARERHPVPSILALAAKGARILGLFDDLLVMRNKETTAHGPATALADVEELLARRLPALREATALVLDATAGATFVGRCGGEALVFVGPSPTPVDGSDVPEGDVWLSDVQREPILPLSPVVVTRRPFEGEPAALFYLDGTDRHRAAYVALPSGATHLSATAWDALDPQLATRTEDDSSREGFATRPFRGLSSFQEEDRELFFGRELESEALANRIRSSPILTVTGPSGSGKSSLVLAGALPRLADFEHVVLAPSPNPARQLADRLAKLSGDPGSFETIEAAIRERPAAVAKALARFSAQSDRAPLVVVDQAEELLTLTKADERAAVASFLAAVAEDGGRVVLVVREDFFARLVVTGALRGRASSAVEVLAPPDRDAVVRALVLPARAFGYAWEDGLVDELVDETEGSEARLALVQFVADKLWDARDPSWKRLGRVAYRAMGGAFGAMARHAEETHASLSPRDRRVAEAVLSRLLGEAGTRNVLSREEAVTGLGPGAGAVVDRLVDARLLSSREGPRGEALVELSHEALVAHWPRLTELSRRKRSDDELAVSVLRLARAWDERGRPTDLTLRGGMLADAVVAREALPDLSRAFVDASLREEARRRRTGRALLGVALAVSSIASIALSFAWRKASEEADRAKALARREERAKWAGQGLAAEREGRPSDAAAMLLAARALGDTDDTTAAALDRVADLEISFLPLTDAAALLALDRTSVTVASPSGVETRALHDLARREPEHGGTVDRLGTEDGLGPRRVRVVGRELEIAEGASVRTFAPHDRPLARVGHALSSLVTVATDGEVKLWREDGRGPPRTLLPRGARLIDAAKAPGVLAVARTDGVFVVRESRGRAKAVAKHEAPVASLAFRDGSLVSVARAVDVQGVSRLRVDLQADALTAAESPDGLVVGARDGSVRLVRRDGTTTPLAAHGGYVTDVLAVHGRVLSVGTDARLRMVEVGGGAREARLSGAPLRLAASPDGTVALVATDDDRVTAFDVATARPVRTVDISMGHASAVARTSDGFAVGDLSGTVSRVALDGVVRTLSTDAASVRCVAAGPDDALVVGREDGVLELFGPGGVTGLGRLDGPVTACALSADHVAAGSASGEVRVLTRGGVLVRSVAQDARITAVALDGRGQAASASRDGEVVELALVRRDPRHATNVRVCKKDGTLRPLVPLDPSTAWGCPTED